MRSLTRMGGGTGRNVGRVEAETIGIGDNQAAIGDTCHSFERPYEAKYVIRLGHLYIDICSTDTIVANSH